MSTAQTNVIEPVPSVPLPGPWLNGPARRMTLRKLRKPEIVMGYLQENGFLIPVIEEASEKLVEYFGEDTPQVLEVRYHPDDGSCDLFLYVQTKLPVSEAFATMDRFDWDWWLDEMPRSQFKLVIAIG